MHASHQHNYPNGLKCSLYKGLRHLAVVCSRELFTDDVIRTEGIRVELSQLATKHINTQSNGLVTVGRIGLDRTKQKKQEIIRYMGNIRTSCWQKMSPRHVQCSHRKK